MIHIIINNVYRIPHLYHRNCDHCPLLVSKHDDHRLANWFIYDAFSLKIFAVYKKKCKLPP